MATTQARQDNDAAGGAVARDARQGGEGETATATCRQPIMEWIQDRRNVDRGGDGGNKKGEGATVEGRELEPMRLRIGHQGHEELTRWIDDHITATLRGGVTTTRRWGRAIWGWLLERADIRTLPRQGPEMFDN